MQVVALLAPQLILAEVEQLLDVALERIGDGDAVKAMGALEMVADGILAGAGQAAQAQVERVSGRGHHAYTPPRRTRRCGMKRDS